MTFSSIILQKLRRKLIHRKRSLLQEEYKNQAQEVLSSYWKGKQKAYGQITLPRSHRKSVALPQQETSFRLTTFNTLHLLRKWSLRPSLPSLIAIGHQPHVRNSARLWRFNHEQDICGLSIYGSEHVEGDDRSNCNAAW